MTYERYTPGEGITPRSPAQAAASMAGRLAATERIRPDVAVIAIPIPGSSLATTLAYLLAEPDGGFGLVDPGWDDPACLEVLEQEVTALGHHLDDLRWIVATHHHRDHLGSADGLRTRTGATVVLSREEQDVVRELTTDADSIDAELRGWGVPDARRAEVVADRERPYQEPVEADRLIADRDILELGSHRLSVVATPGHTRGHVCLADAERGLLYTGDHVLPRVVPGLGLGPSGASNPILDYFASLDALAPFDDLEVAPGHDYVFRGLAIRRRQLAEHHLHRLSEVAELSAELGDATVWEYASRLTWTAGWENLAGFYLQSALVQTAWHRDLVASGRAGDLLASGWESRR